MCADMSSMRSDDHRPKWIIVRQDNIMLQLINGNQYVAEPFGCQWQFLCQWQFSFLNIIEIIQSQVSWHWLLSLKQWRLENLTWPEKSEQGSYVQFSANVSVCDNGHIYIRTCQERDNRVFGNISEIQCVTTNSGYTLNVMSHDLI